MTHSPANLNGSFQVEAQLSGLDFRHKSCCSNFADQRMVGIAYVQTTYRDVNKENFG